MKPDASLQEGRAVSSRGRGCGCLLAAAPVQGGADGAEDLVRT